MFLFGSRIHFPNESQRKAYMFFNCDEWNSYASMNPAYNSHVFRDYRDSRRELWTCVKSALERNEIIINENDVTIVRKAILEGDPTDANDHMKYGQILKLDCY